jgi:hypothetical protein
VTFATRQLLSIIAAVMQFHQRLRFLYESAFGQLFLVSNPKHSFVILAPKFSTKNAGKKH